MSNMSILNVPTLLIFLLFLERGGMGREKESWSKRKSDENRERKKIREERSKRFEEHKDYDNCPIKDIDKPIKSKALKENNQRKKGG